MITEAVEWAYSIRTLSARWRSCGRCICRPTVVAHRVLWLGRSPSESLVPARSGCRSGFGQIRTSMQLPVLTMITGYARWVLAVLVPTRRAELLCRTK